MQSQQSNERTDLVAPKPKSETKEISATPTFDNLSKDETLYSYLSTPQPFQSYDIPGIVDPSLQEPDPIRVGFTNTFKASWNLNLFSGLQQSLGFNDYLSDPRVKAFDDLIPPGEEFDVNAYFFSNKSSIQSIPGGEYIYGQFMKGNYNNKTTKEELFDAIGFDYAKIEYGKTLAQASGVDNVASFLGSALDPVLLPLLVIPGGAAARGAGLFAKVGYGTLGGAAVNGLYSLANEGVWQSVDPDRTTDESLSNVVFDVGVGAGLGAVFGLTSYAFGRRVSSAEVKDTIKSTSLFKPSPGILSNAEKTRRRFGRGTEVIEFELNDGTTGFVSAPLKQIKNLIKGGLSEEDALRSIVTKNKLKVTGDVSKVDFKPVDIKNIAIRSLKTAAGSGPTSGGRYFIGKSIEKFLENRGYSKEVSGLIGDVSGLLGQAILVGGVAAIGLTWLNKGIISSLKGLAGLDPKSKKPLTLEQVQEQRLQGGTRKAMQELGVEMFFTPMLQAANLAFEPITDSTSLLRENLETIKIDSGVARFRQYSAMLSQAYEATLEASPKNLLDYIQTFMASIPDQLLQNLLVSVFEPLSKVNQSNLEGIDGVGGDIQSLMTFDFAIRAIDKTIDDVSNNKEITVDWTDEVLQDSLAEALMAGILSYNSINYEDSSLPDLPVGIYAPINPERAMSFAAMSNELLKLVDKEQLTEDEELSQVLSIPVNQILALENLKFAIYNAYKQRYDFIQDKPFVLSPKEKQEWKEIEKVIQDKTVTTPIIEENNSSLGNIEDIIKENN